MSKVTVEFETDNAAFQEDPDEIAACLRRVAQAIAAGRGTGKVMDTNGNSVGTWTVER